MPRTLIEGGKIMVEKRIIQIVLVSVFGVAVCLIAAAWINQRKADALEKHIGAIGKEAA